MQHTFASELVSLADEVNKKKGMKNASNIIEALKKECIKAASTGMYSILLSPTNENFIELYNYSSNDRKFTIEAFENMLNELGLKYEMYEEAFCEPTYRIKFN